MIVSTVVLFAVVLLISRFTQFAEAAERAWITTDGTMAYSDGAWIAAGGVKLVQGDVEVNADRMRGELESGRGDDVGNVFVTEENNSLAAVAVTRDVD